MSRTLFAHDKTIQIEANARRRYITTRAIELLEESGAFTKPVPPTNAEVRDAIMLASCEWGIENVL